MKYRDFYKHLLAEDTLGYPKIKYTRGKHVDKIAGGKGDKAIPEDFDPREISLGMVVEREHSDDEEIILSIVLDHLSENEHYYSILKSSGLADELTQINPGSELGDKDNPINKPCRHGTDITPTPGNNIVGTSGDTPSMDERDGESNLDKMIKSKEKSDMKQKDKDPELELKEDATPESEKKHVTKDSKEHEIAWDGTKKGLPASTPTKGIHGGGKIEGTKKFGDTENRLMKLAGMGGIVTSPCVLGMMSNGPEIKVTPKEDGAEEIEIDLDEKSKSVSKPTPKQDTDNFKEKPTTITSPGITSDMVSKKPGQEGKKLRWSIPFNK